MNHNVLRHFQTISIFVISVTIRKNENLIIIGDSHLQTISYELIKNDRLGDLIFLLL